MDQCCTVLCLYAASGMDQYAASLTYMQLLVWISMQLLVWISMQLSLYADLHGLATSGMDQFAWLGNMRRYALVFGVRYLRKLVKKHSPQHIYRAKSRKSGET